MSNNSAATVDGSRFVTEKVAEEGGVISGSAGGSPASKHDGTGGDGGDAGGGDGGDVSGGIGGGDGGGGTPQTTNKGGVPDGNCSPGGAPQKGKKKKSDRKAFTLMAYCRGVNIRGFTRQHRD